MAVQIALYNSGRTIFFITVKICQAQFGLQHIGVLSL